MQAVLLLGAQDLDANYFWESLGFVPSRFGRGRIKGERAYLLAKADSARGMTTTPYWYPSQTNAGAIREDRLVLPIPPGTQWSDAKPIVLPREAVKALPEPEARRQRKVSPPAPKRRLGIRCGSGRRLRRSRRKRKRSGEGEERSRSRRGGRELRDRYLEQFNAEQLSREHDGERLAAGEVCVEPGEVGGVGGGAVAVGTGGVNVRHKELV